MRIAAVQCSPIDDDAARAGAAIVDHLRWARRAGIDLLLFPEAFLLGHSYDPATIHARAARAAAALDALCQQITTCPVTLVLGAFDTAPPHVFNSAFVIEEGRIIGRYAKAHPNEPGVSPGHAFPTFVRSGVRYGINICNDANHADAADRIARQGADLILYPLNNMLPPATADRWREKSIANLVDRARQTGCWIASSDVAGVSGDRMSYGCTAIVAPDGSVVARVPELGAGVAVYDIPARLPSQTAA